MPVGMSNKRTWYDYAEELGPRAAARQLGCDHSSVSRVLAGECKPQMLLLSALSVWEDIDLDETRAEYERRNEAFKARRMEATHG